MSRESIATDYANLQKLQEWELVIPALQSSGKLVLQIYDGSGFVLKAVDMTEHTSEIEALVQAEIDDLKTAIGETP